MLVTLESGSALRLVYEMTPPVLTKPLYYHKLKETASVPSVDHIIRREFLFPFPFIAVLYDACGLLDIWRFVVISVMALAACKYITLVSMVCRDFYSSFLSSCLRLQALHTSSNAFGLAET